MATEIELSKIDTIKLEDTTEEWILEEPKVEYVCEEIKLIPSQF